MPCLRFVSQLQSMRHVGGRTRLFPCLDNQHRWSASKTLAAAEAKSRAAQAGFWDAEGTFMGDFVEAGRW